MQTVGHLHLSKRGWSEAHCIAVSGSVIGATTAAFSLANATWHLYVLYTLNGLVSKSPHAPAPVSVHHVRVRLCHP